MLNDVTEIKNSRDVHALEKYRFIHNFIPHEHNKTRATLLSHRWFLTYILGLFLIFGVFRLLPRLIPGVLGYASNIKTTELFNLTNKTRETAGLGDLKLNSELSAAAQKKAEDMFKDNYWAHVSPSGKEPWDFILAQNYDYAYAGENLAKNFNSSREVVEAWYKSPSHRENLLSKNYDEIGFAVVDGVLDGYKTTLVVQMFGRPRQPSYLAGAQGNNKPVETITETSAVTAAPAVPIKEMAVLPSSSSPVLDFSDITVKAPFVVNMSVASKFVSLAFGGFVTGLLGLDLWYSKRRSIPKFTGHTLAHFTILIIAVLGVWFVLVPGRIL